MSSFTLMAVWSSIAWPGTDRAAAHRSALAKEWSGISGSTTHMLFYCAGGLIWYGLLLRSNYVPRVIGAFGVAAAGLGLAGIIADLLGATVPMAVYVPLLPFELSIGGSLVAKGIRTAEG